MLQLFGGNGCKCHGILDDNGHSLLSSCTHALNFAAINMLMYTYLLRYCKISNIHVDAGAIFPKKRKRAYKWEALRVECFVQCTSIEHLVCLKLLIFGCLCHIHYALSDFTVFVKLQCLMRFRLTLLLTCIFLSNL